MKIVNLTENDLTKLVKKILREQTDVSSVASYPKCVQRFGYPTMSSSGQWSIVGTGAYKSYRFYATGKVLKPDGKLGNFTCEEGGGIVIDGQKLGSDKTTFPRCALSVSSSQPIKSGDKYVLQGNGRFADFQFSNDQTAYSISKKQTYRFTCGSQGLPIIDTNTPVTAAVATPQAKAPETYQGSTQTTDARLQNIAKVYNTLDANQNVTNDKYFKGKPFQDWKNYYKVTDNELELAKKNYGTQKPNAPKGTQKPKPAASRRSAVPQGVPSAQDLEAFLK